MPAQAPVPQVRLVRVGANDAGQRLDNFLLKHLPGVPKSHVYRLLRSGQVRVDKGRCKPDRRLVEGEEVRIPPVRIADRGEPVRPPDAVLDRVRAAILQDDVDYLVLNKPAGLAVHAGSGLHYGVIEALRALGDYEYIELCHRLDRDTSGVLLLAKSRPALLRAQSAFRSGAADKHYVALLCGAWSGGARTVDSALSKNHPQGGERMVLVDEDGKPAKSRFTPKRRYRHGVLCDVEIYSGRTHQIRVHAAEIGHAVAGDGKYGRREDNRWAADLGLKRTFLHAQRLNLPAAEDYPALSLHAPLPDDLQVILDRLGPGT